VKPKEAVAPTIARDRLRHTLCPMFGRWRTRGDHHDRSLHCSFCGKHRTKVKFLVAGPGVYICNACVDLCNKVITKRRALNR
jgi:hypothetical protein